MKQASDFDNVLWGLVNFKHHTLGFLKDRGYLISSSVEMQDTGPETGTLVVRGFLRGQGLDPDQLLHIPGQGHFRISKIVTSADPFSENSNTVSTHLHSSTVLTNNTYSPLIILLIRDVKLICVITIM